MPPHYSANLIKLAERMCDPHIDALKIESQYQKLKEVSEELPGFIYVPSIEKYVAEETTHKGKTWYEAHEALHKNNEAMLTLPEFVEFLKYLQNSKTKKHKIMLNTIIEERVPWRGEWLDARFEVIDSKYYILSHHKTIDGKLTPKERKEIQGPYLKVREYIDLNDWLQRATEDGLPPENIKGDHKEQLFYYHPVKNRVAWFGANSDRAILSCDGGPSDSYESLGVRAVRAKNKSL